MSTSEHIVLNDIDIDLAAYFLLIIVIKSFAYLNIMIEPYHCDVKFKKKLLGDIWNGDIYMYNQNDFLVLMDNSKKTCVLICNGKKFYQRWFWGIQNGRYW